MEIFPNNYGSRAVVLSKISLVWAPAVALRLTRNFLFFGDENTNDCVGICTFLFLKKMHNDCFEFNNVCDLF